MNERTGRKSIPAIKIRQWLSDWDEIEWNPDENRAKPPRLFYQFSMKASDLKALSGVYPRTTDRTRSSEDLGIQRAHQDERSKEIRRFVEFGYPWSALSEPRRRSDEFCDLRQPGWLPTALVINILTPGDERKGRRVSAADLVKIENVGAGTAKILLPEGFGEEGSWRSEAIPPIEVIDGQHRLWAFEDANLEGKYELPVVAFEGLDLSWQAYLFYTINIKPKKINPSLAFDLYPLLRTEEWLAKFEGHMVYRETRAQEIVDRLWWHPRSPWHQRINMLGETGYKGTMVTQAAWVRSLLHSFVKSWEGTNVRIGGLYGAVVGRHETVLSWTLNEQAAFLIFVGRLFQKAVEKSSAPWAEELRRPSYSRLFPVDEDIAFFGSNNLLNQDQGIRILLQVVNDLCYVRADQLGLLDWGGVQGEEDEEQIDSGISSLEDEEEIVVYLADLSESLASYDWRASSASGLTEAQRTLKASFRGSGGYKELRVDMLRHLVSEGKGDIAGAAAEVRRRLGY